MKPSTRSLSLAAADFAGVCGREGSCSSFYFRRHRYRAVAGFRVFTLAGKGVLSQIALATRLSWQQLSSGKRTGAPLKGKNEAHLPVTLAGNSKPNSHSRESACRQLRTSQPLSRLPQRTGSILTATVSIGGGRCATPKARPLHAAPRDHQNPILSPNRSSPRSPRTTKNELARFAAKPRFAPSVTGFCWPRPTHSRRRTNAPLRAEAQPAQDSGAPQCRQRQLAGFTTNWPNSKIAARNRTAPELSFVRERGRTRRRCRSERLMRGAARKRAHSLAWRRIGSISASHGTMHVTRLVKFAHSIIRRLRLRVRGKLGSAPLSSLRLALFKHRASQWAEHS